MEKRKWNYPYVNEELIDPLTGCLKYMAFTELVSGHLERFPDDKYGILYFDVDNLTYINNIYGYEIGDRVLAIIGEVCAELRNPKEFVSRIADDRFVILYDVDDAGRRELDNTFALAQVRISELMKEIGAKHSVKLYAGAYRIEKDDIQNKTVTQMVDYAVLAHKACKREKNRAIVIFDDTLLKQQVRENVIINALDDALQNEGITLFYQPQVDCRNGNVVGAEVLCRWNHPELGFIAPSEFIPIFERHGQICKLDQYMWEHACVLLKKWKDKKVHTDLPLSVNVSRRDIQDVNLEEYFTELVHKYDIAPDLLRIEITESAYMDEPKQLIDIVKGLKNRGFVVEMDDFGSGYSSLNMLKEVPVDVLKLDFRFLSNTDETESDSSGAIISAVIRMAKGIGMAVIAEGVETEQQCVALHNMGCTIIQGYYYAKPMPEEQFEQFLQTHISGLAEAKRDLTELSHMNELLNYNSNSAYIFDHYIGSGAIIEMTDDHMEVLKINDKFLEAMGDKGREALQFVHEGLTLIQDQDKSKAIQTIKTAIEFGEAEIETYLPSTGQWIRILYRLISKGTRSSYLFVEAFNTTDKHILGEQFQKYVNSTEYTLEAIPSGVFKYEADGEQRFSYISRSLLWLLGYKTRDEFLEKFDNSFKKMIYEEDRERILGEIDAQITEFNHIDYCEYRIEMADGTLKWVSDYGHIVTDKNGKRWYYVVVSDADKVKAAKAASAAKEKELELLANVTRTRSFQYFPGTDLLVVRYPDQNGIWGDSKTENFLQVMVEKGVVAESSADKVHEAVAKAISSRETVVFHVDCKVGSNPMKHYRCNCGGVFDDNGKIERIVGILIE